MGQLFFVTPSLGDDRPPTTKPCGPIVSEANSGILANCPFRPLGGGGSVRSGLRRSSPVRLSALRMVRDDLHRNQVLDIDQAQRRSLGIHHGQFIDPKFSNQTHGIPDEIFV